MYPAPTRQEFWQWGIEFHDGTRIIGTSAEDVCERWARIFAQALGHPVDLPELIRLVGRWAIRTMQSVPDFERFVEMRDEPDASEFLHHLQSLKLIDLYRK